MSHIVDCLDPDARTAGLAAAHEAVQRGECVVLPTDTVYGIGVDAFSPQAVSILLAAKGRSRTMPPPVLISSPAVMDALADEVPETARRLAEAFWPGALTLILPAQPSLAWDLGETRGTVALRMPADGLALDLLGRVGPMAVSSANRTAMPAATTASEAEQMLGEAVSVYLDDGERSTTRPSTIVDCTLATPQVVRDGAVSLAELQAIAPEVRGPRAAGEGGDAEGSDADAPVDAPVDAPADSSDED